MIYPNKPLYLLSLLGYIYYLTYYTLTTKDNIIKPLNYYTILLKTDNSIINIITYYVNKCVARLLKCAVICFEFVI